MDRTVSINLRLPSNLRDRVAKLAHAGNRSLNSEVVERLQTSTAGRSTLLQVITMPKCVRVVGAGTGASLSNFLTAAAELDADHVLLGARRDEFNGAELVAALHSPQLTVLMDDGSLNLARRPRVAEIAQLLRGLQRLDLLSTARYLPQHLADTRAETADAALSQILAQPIRPLHMESFLELLSAGRAVDLDEVIAFAAA